MVKQFIGVYIFVIGLSILTAILFPQVPLEYIICINVMIISIHLIILSIVTKKSKTKRIITVGITVLLSCIFFIVYFAVLKHYFILLELWPCLGIFFAIGLFVYYLISETKSPATIIPSIFIFITSTVILLITIGLLKLDIVKIFLIIAACLIIFIGLYLIFNLDFINFFKKNKSDSKSDNQ